MGELIAGMDSPRSVDVQELLAVHLAFANEHSPPEDVHALDVTGLLEESVSFFSIREDGRLLGVGAINQLDESHGELKSIHTAETARGRGVGRAMVDHLVAIARARGYRRVSLETGSMAAFTPSRALYAAAGFEVCEPFADYRSSPYSVCMTLDLDERDSPGSESLTGVTGADRDSDDVAS
jgi:putative acetyltransferase